MTTIACCNATNATNWGILQQFSIFDLVNAVLYLGLAFWPALIAWIPTPAT